MTSQSSPVPQTATQPNQPWCPQKNKLSIRWYLERTTGLEQRTASIPASQRKTIKEEICASGGHPNTLVVPEASLKHTSACLDMLACLSASFSPIFRDPRPLISPCLTYHLPYLGKIPAKTPVVGIRWGPRPAPYLRLLTPTGPAVSMERDSWVPEKGRTRHCAATTSETNMHGKYQGQQAISASYQVLQPCSVNV